MAWIYEQKQRKKNIKICKTIAYLWIALSIVLDLFETGVKRRIEM
jgi:hypothetical protein